MEGKHDNHFTNGVYNADKPNQSCSLLAGNSYEKLPQLLLQGVLHL